MGKFQNVLLVSDFDNTVVDTASVLRGERFMPSPGEKTLEVLNYFIGQGGRFSVATGRALASFSPFAHLLPMNGPAVLCNGAVLYDFDVGEYLDINCLPQQTQQRLQPVLKAHPAVAAEAYHIANTIYAVQANEITRGHRHITYVEARGCMDLTGVPGPLGKLMLEGDHRELEEILKQLRRMPWSGEYELNFSAPEFLEITAKGASKGGMVCRLAERLKIDMSHVYCVGDEANDLSMLAVAAQGFAPANCVEAVRQSGATIVADCSRDTLAEVIEQLDKRYEE